MRSRKAEYFVAIGSFLAAVAFAFASLFLSDTNEVAAGNCTVIAQFLLLTASIFGIDYHFDTKFKRFITHGKDKKQDQSVD